MLTLTRCSVHGMPSWKTSSLATPALCSVHGMTSLHTSSLTTLALCIVHGMPFWETRSPKAHTNTMQYTWHTYLQDEPPPPPHPLKDNTNTMPCTYHTYPEDKYSCNHWWSLDKAPHCSMGQIHTHLSQSCTWDQWNQPEVISKQLHVKLYPCQNVYTVGCRVSYNVKV